LAIAIEERTYLTTVFPVSVNRRFQASLADALAQILFDLGMPQQVVHSESAAVEYKPLMRLSDRGMVSVLSDVEFFLGIELAYHTDLRTVQLNLNAIPHPNRDPCVPSDAVRQLFQKPASKRALAVH
jgi:hypothetical protein